MLNTSRCLFALGLLFVFTSGCSTHYKPLKNQTANERYDQNNQLNLSQLSIENLKKVVTKTYDEHEKRYYFKFNRIRPKNIWTVSDHVLIDFSISISDSEKAKPNLMLVVQSQTPTWLFWTKASFLCRETGWQSSMDFTQTELDRKVLDGGSVQETAYRMTDLDFVRKLKECETLSLKLMGGGQITILFAKAKDENIGLLIEPYPGLRLNDALHEIEFLYLDLMSEKRILK